VRKKKKLSDGTKTGASKRKDAKVYLGGLSIKYTELSLSRGRDWQKYLFKTTLKLLTGLIPS
jgi:hypothetical protein